MGDYKWVIEKISDEELDDAIYTYLVSRLPKADRDIMEAVKRNYEAIDKRQNNIANMQKQCNHPLSFREYHNVGNGVSYYATQHRCHICDLYWKTNQRWDLVGDKRGMPDDPEAKTD